MYLMLVVFGLVDKVQLVLKVGQMAVFLHVDRILFLQVHLNSLILIHVGWSAMDQAIDTLTQ